MFPSGITPICVWIDTMQIICMFMFGVVVVEIVNNNYYYRCLNCIIISHFRCGAGWGVGFI